MMSKIRYKNTRPEIFLRSLLFKEGFRFRIHVKMLPGKPDIVLKKHNTAIFVHGCFWHFHKDCRDGRIPNTNSKFWKEKLSKNIQRDELHIETLKNLGWNIIVVWECELNKPSLLATLKRIKKVILKAKKIESKC